MRSDVDRHPLPEARSPLVVPDEHRAAVEPEDPAVRTDDPKLLVEGLAGLLAPPVRRIDALAIVRMDVLREVGRVREQVLGGLAEDLGRLGAEVREPGLVRGPPNSSMKVTAGICSTSVR